MTCYHPLKANYDHTEKTKNNKRRVKILRKNQQHLPYQFTLPCGQCVGCRLEYSRQWAVRIHHENQMHESSCFITLTYNDEKLPDDHSLKKKDFQDFMKRYRNHFRYREMNKITKRYNTKYTKKIRYFQSGEYGEPTYENNYIARPHYHAIIFGHDFEDKQFLKEKEGIVLYTSDTLADLWGNGNASVGAVTFKSAAYVARYCLKKTNGSQVSPDEYFEKYNKIDRETGEYSKLQPEYATMSRGGTGKGEGGIGQSWYKKYKKDAYPKDYLTIKGVEQKPPKYYDYLYDMDPEGCLQTIKDIRMSKIKEKDNTPERLQVRETVKIAQISNLKRSIK